METVGVLGAGAWGLALADYLARLNRKVVVWDRSLATLELLRTSRTANRPKGLIVHNDIQFVDTIPEVVEKATVILSVVPSYATADICRALADIATANEGLLFVNCSKGIEEETLRLPHQIFAESLGHRSDFRYAVLAGPSHAEEVSKGILTAVVAATGRPDDLRRLQDLFFSSTFRVYGQSDIIGVELGGALKNVQAIAAGICDGMDYGDNTKAALITRGVAEIARLGEAMGARPDTVAGLSGLGDLIVTAMSQHSRNRAFGELIASGITPAAALEKIGAVVEGYRTAHSAFLLARKHNVDMPISEAVYQVLYKGVDIVASINNLLDRDASAEIYH